MTTEQSKKSIFPDRANLSPEISKRLENWADQVNKASDGATKVSKSDIANFFLGEVENELDWVLLAKIEMRFFDEARWLSWATAKIKSSKQQEVRLSIDELLKGRKDRWAKVTRKPADSTKPNSKSKLKTKPNEITNTKEPTVISDSKVDSHGDPNVENESA